MTELLEVIASWPTLSIAIAVFGFAPGYVLRWIVKIYPPNDPRRRELVAELYAVPRIQRPFFVAEQLETALHEGLPRRWGVLLGYIPAVRRRRARRNVELASRAILRAFGLTVPDRDISFRYLNNDQLEAFAELAEVSMDDLLRLSTTGMYARWSTASKDYTVLEWLRRRSRLRMQRYSRRPLPPFAEVMCVCTCTRTDRECE